MTTEMKPSGIAWIGDIPLDWNMKKIKFISTLKGRIGWQGLTSDEYTDEGAYLITGTDFDNGHINWETCVHVHIKRWDEAKDIQVDNGDLLITKDGTVGKVAIVDELDSPASLNSGVLRIATFDGYDRRFLFWVLQSEVFWTWFSNKNVGNSTIIHLYQGDFAEFSYPTPPLPEQQAIATFLDESCSQIDTIISDLELQVEILQKYKKALITETVTKGLSKTVILKKKLKYVLSICSGDAVTNDMLSDDDSLFPVFGGGKLIAYYSKTNVTTQNILIGRVGANCGCITQIEKPSWATDNALIVSTTENLKYMYYLLFASNLNGLNDSNAQPLITATKVLNHEILFVEDKKIQQAISDYIDFKCAEADTLISEKQHSIDIMRKYKKSLIYEYVTGKKRVPHATNKHKED
ncbi:MAG: restriction endonuclease subunit S [Anaerovoracaceae bacterium]